MFQKVIGQNPDTAASLARASSEESASNSSITSASQKTPPVLSGRNILSADVEVKGSIKFSNDLVVDGKIEGNIDSDGSLTVGENARIRAEIKTRSVVIYGKVHGNIEVTEKVELKASSELVGDIKAALLSIEPGAIFVGKSTVGSPSAKGSQNQAVNQGKNQSAKQGGLDLKGNSAKSDEPKGDDQKMASAS